MMNRWWLAILVLGAGFALGWMFRGDGNGAATDLSTGAAEEAAGSGAPTLGDAQTRANALARQLEQERSAREAAETEVARLKRERDQTAAGGEGTGAAAARTGKGPRFTYPEVDAALQRVNWTEVGESVHNMGPLLKELAEHLAEGKGYPQRVGEIQRWNGPLLTAALGLSKDGIPGTGANGSFTHPAVLVNMVVATLENAGLPLDGAQLERLARLGTAYVAEDDRRLKSYGPDTLALEKLIGEVRLKDRFYAEIDALVTHEQREALHPEAIRGRVGIDLFSSGLVLSTTGMSVRFGTRPELVERLVQEAASHFRIKAGEPEAALFSRAAADWVQSLPEAWLMEPLDAMARGSQDLPGSVGMPTRRMLEAAERTLDLYRRLLDQLAADSPLAVRLRGESAFVVPVARVP